MRVGPCIPVGIQLEKVEVGPTSGPTWRLSHFGHDEVDEADRRPRDAVRRPVVQRVHVPPGLLWGRQNSRLV
jgi:hypothetical protein